MAKSSIEWTDATWNPVRGCTKISAGCKNCYAANFAERFRGVDGHPYEQGFDLRLIPQKLSEPFTWPRQSFVFVNSMSDLFHPEIPDEFIVQVATVMVAANWHTYQVLTKRAERLANLLTGKLSFAAGVKHIWWGVSVEDRRHGIPRIDYLRRSGAAVKFLSIEPLLEDVGNADLSGLDWVIVGGESGPKSRPIQPEWVEGLRAQCEDKQIPFFFKQWGGTQKKKTGRLLNGRTHDSMPAVIRNEMPSRTQRSIMAAEFNPIPILL